MATTPPKLTKDTINATEFDNDLSDLIRSNGLIKRSPDEFYNKFARFQYLDPYNRLNTTREYVFFTKPDLNIYRSNSTTLNTEQGSGGVGGLPIFQSASKTIPEVLQQLQYSSNTRYPFVNILSNSKKSNLELPSISAGSDIETSANLYGTTMAYRNTSFISDENFEFSMEFEDTKFLEVYMFFKLYDEYERKKIYGIVSPPTDAYVVNRILHDQMSVFKFIVGEDGETIIFFAKLYGVYPKSVPREAFSDMPEDGNLRFSVQFHATFVEDMDPLILTDFNILSRTIRSSGKPADIYNADLAGSIGDWYSAPYIESSKSSKGPNAIQYKLKWR